MYQTATNTTMNVQAVGVSGGNQPHNNLQPYLTINFIIAMAGIFPPRN
jgi:microcystin-dependent protein